MKSDDKCCLCHGSGKRMGIGMMMRDCKECSGSGKTLIKKPDLTSIYKTLEYTPVAPAKSADLLPLITEIEEKKRRGRPKKEAVDA